MIDQLTGTTWIGPHRDAESDVPHLLLYPAPALRTSISRWVGPP